MNDFTEEELRLMYVVINQITIETTQPPCVHELRDKVKEMSLNYCEHDWRKGVHLFNDIYCANCHQHFKVNNDE